VRLLECVKLQVGTLPKPDSVESAISARFVGMTVVFVARYRIVRTPQGVTWAKVVRVPDLEELGNAGRLASRSVFVTSPPFPLTLSVACTIMPQMG
jgi:hypothetical protein